MANEGNESESEFAAASFEVPGFGELLAAVRNRDAIVAENAFKEGFKKGWSEAFKQIQSLAHKQSETAKGQKLSSSVEIGNGKIVMRRHDGEKIGTYQIGDKGVGTKEVVKQFVFRNPGLRGVELVAKIAIEGFDFPERTIRTALHRLKLSDEIRVVDGRWYTPESAPPDPLSLLREEDDDAAAS